MQAETRMERGMRSRSPTLDYLLAGRLHLRNQHETRLCLRPSRVTHRCPYFAVLFIGSALGRVFPDLLALTISPTKAIIVGGLFLILARLDGNVLRPLIFSHEIGMSPGMVLIPILVLGVLLGPIISVFLAIPAAVLHNDDSGRTNRKGSSGRCRGGLEVSRRRTWNL